MSELSGVNPGKAVGGGRVWAPVVTDSTSTPIDDDLRRDIFITFAHVAAVLVPPIIYSLVVKTTGKVFYGNQAEALGMIMYLVFIFSFLSLFAHLIKQAKKIDYKVWWQGAINAFLFVTLSLAIFVVAFFMVAQPLATKAVNDDFSQWAQTNYSVSLKSPDKTLDSAKNVEFLDKNNKTVLYDLVLNKNTDGITLKKVETK